MDYEMKIESLKNLDKALKDDVCTVFQKDTMTKLILNGYFKPSVSYPKKPERPRLPQAHDSRDAKKYADDLDKYEVEKERYQAALNRYRESLRESELIFKFACFYDVGWDMGSPACHVAFEKAWSRGHGHGLQEVHNEVVELDDIIRCMGRPVSKYR